jgi:hypothetical protein
MTKALDERQATTRYHVPLTPKQVLARLAEQPGVRAYDRHSLPDFAGVLDDTAFTVEIEADGFRVHCGQPGARGQSGTGMLRMLYLVGRFEPTEHGTAITLHFARHRPRWAWQRAAGLIAMATLGLLWVVAGPGVLAKKALLYGLMVVAVTPVLVHDLRHDQRQDEQRKALLNLLEHVLGPLQLGALPSDEPYRKRLRPADDADDDDDADADD